MLALPKVIGLTGAAGAGKSTVARLLMAHHGYQLMPFAKVLKNMLLAAGLSEEQVSGTEKELPMPHWGNKTPRQLMQTLGTQWGRDLVDQDLWIRLWLHNSEGRRVVADDVRFVNEVMAIERRDGVIIRVVRDGHAGTQSTTHISERALLTLETNHTINNAGSLVDLRKEVSRVLRSVGNDSAKREETIEAGHSAAAF